jgi:hypothetical protein
METSEAMKSRIVSWAGAAVIGAVLHSGAALADAPPPPPSKAGIALELAELYGRTLGAASQCPDIAQDRVRAVTAKAGAHLRTLATGPDAGALVGQRFTDAISRGASEVQSGETTCVQASADFGNLDHELASDAPAAPGAGAAGATKD